MSKQICVLKVIAHLGPHAFALLVDVQHVAALVVPDKEILGLSVGKKNKMKGNIW